MAQIKIDLSKLPLRGVDEARKAGIVLTPSTLKKGKKPLMNNNSSQIKSICVYGVGGVGGYIGGKMAHTVDNRPDITHKIYFIARGEHLDVIQRKGIQVVTPEKTLTPRKEK